MTSEERHEVRQKRSVPILNEFKQWADAQRVPAKSKTGKALTYLDNQWKYLKNYTLDGRLEISNNFAERSIKPFVIGRKNFRFSNILNGAQSTAVTMSVIETAKANGIDPYKYLMWIFKTAPAIKTDDDDKSWLYCWYRKNSLGKITISKKDVTAIERLHPFYVVQFDGYDILIINEQQCIMIYSGHPTFDKTA